MAYYLRMKQNLDESGDRVVRLTSVELWAAEVEAKQFLRKHKQLDAVTEAHLLTSVVVTGTSTLEPFDLDALKAERAAPVAQVRLPIKAADMLVVLSPEERAAELRKLRDTDLTLYALVKDRLQWLSARSEAFTWDVEPVSPSVATASVSEDLGEMQKTEKSSPSPLDMFLGKRASQSARVLSMSHVLDLVDELGPWLVKLPRAERREQLARLEDHHGLRNFLIAYLNEAVAE